MFFVFWVACTWAGAPRLILTNTHPPRAPSCCTLPPCSPWWWWRRCCGADFWRLVATGNAWRWRTGPKWCCKERRDPHKWGHRHPKARQCSVLGAEGCSAKGAGGTEAGCFWTCKTVASCGLSQCYLNKDEKKKSHLKAKKKNKAVVTQSAHYGILIHFFTFACSLWWGRIFYFLFVYHI